MKARIAIALTLAAVFALATVPAQAIYVSNCPQVCTPNCPCSIQCLGPFGTTTCGAAGQACTGLTETAEDTLHASMTPADADADEAFLLELQAQDEVEPVNSDAK